jgi:hypothetical protein
LQVSGTHEISMFSPKIVQVANNGTAANYSNTTVGGYVVEDGTLTAGNISTLSTAFNSLMADLGRG